MRFRSLTHSFFILKLLNGDVFLEKDTLERDTSNKNTVENIEVFRSFFDYENIGEFFEKDARRYKRYLGDDILKEQVI